MNNEIQCNSINFNTLQNCIQYYSIVYECLPLPKESQPIVAEKPLQNYFDTFKCFLEKFAYMKTLFFTNVSNCKKELLEAFHFLATKSFRSDVLTKIV